MNYSQTFYPVILNGGASAGFHFHFRPNLASRGAAKQGYFLPRAPRGKKRLRNIVLHQSDVINERPLTGKTEMYGWI